MAYLGRMHLLHGRDVVQVLGRLFGRYHDLWLGAWLLLLLLRICLVHPLVRLAHGLLDGGVWVRLLELWLRIALGHLALHRTILRGICRVLVPIRRLLLLSLLLLLLLLGCVRYILAVGVGLRRPVEVLARIHDANSLGRAVTECRLARAASSRVVGLWR
jgi:hypothetical protein